MDEDHHTTYKDGDIVWVKLNGKWWPGQVKDLNSIPLDEIKKPPLVLVQFFEEDSYQYVKSWDNIYPYNCEKKTEFIKKGMAAFRTKASHMEKFPKDVTTAEVTVGGNPNILSEPQFRPEVKRNYASEIFGTPNSKKRTNTDNSTKRSTTKTQPDTSHITHRRFLGSDDYKAYICIQYPGKDRTPDSEDEEVIQLNTEPERDYNCHDCSYSTKRLEVMILHIKSHIQFDDRPPMKKRKKPVTPKPKKKEPAKRQRVSSSQLNDTSNDEAPEPPKERKKKTKTSPSVKKSPKVVEEVKPKNSSDIRNDLLAEWDDEEEELSETQDMSVISDLSILNENTFTAIDQIPEPIVETEVKTIENDDKEPEVTETLSPTDKADDSSKIDFASSGDTSTQNDSKCCFDFNEEEEELLNTTVQVGRKIPRVIPPTEKRKSEILDDIIDLEEGFNKEEILKESQSFNEKRAENNEFESAFKDLMDEVSVPKISDLENSLKPPQNFHSVKTIKFPDKQDDPPQKDRDKNHPDVPTEPINPKKRFVKNFEEFENRLNKEKMKSKKQQALKKKSKKEILFQDKNDESSDKTSDDDCKDIHELHTKIMSSIIDEANIDEESKEKIMSKLNKSPRRKIVDSCSTDSNAEPSSPSQKVNSKDKQQKHFNKNASSSDVDINISQKNEGRVKKFFRRSTELKTVDTSKAQQQEPTATNVRCTNKTEDSLMDTHLKQQEIGTRPISSTPSVDATKLTFKKRSLRSSSELSSLDKSHHIEPGLSSEIVYSGDKDDKKGKRHDKHKKIKSESIAGVDDSDEQKEKAIAKDLSHSGATRRQHYSLSEINIVETSTDQKEALSNVHDMQDQPKAISKTRKSLRNSLTETKIENETVNLNNVSDKNQENPCTVTNKSLGSDNVENKVVFSQDFYIRDNSKKETLPRKKRKFVTDSFPETSVDQSTVHPDVIAHQEIVIDTLREETLPLKRRRSLRVSSAEATMKQTTIIPQDKEELNTTIAPTNTSNNDSTEKNQKGKNSDKTKRISHPKKRTRSFQDNFDTEKPLLLQIETENKKEMEDLNENAGAETHDSKTQINDCVPHESETKNVETFFETPENNIVEGNNESTYEDSKIIETESVESKKESEFVQIPVAEDAVNKEPVLITENAARLDSNSPKLQENVSFDIEPQSSSEILVHDHKPEEIEREPIQQCTDDQNNVVQEVCSSESENISVINRNTELQDHPITSAKLNVDLDLSDKLSKKQKRNKRKSSKHKHKKKGKTNRHVEPGDASDIECSNIEVGSKTPVGDGAVEEVSICSPSAQNEAEIVNKEPATIKETIIEKNTVDPTEEIDYIPELEPVTDENHVSITESKEVEPTEQSTESQFSEIKETNESIDSSVDTEKPLFNEANESTEFIDNQIEGEVKIRGITEPEEEVYLAQDEQPAEERIITQKSSILGATSVTDEEGFNLTPEEPTQEQTLEKYVVAQEEEEFDLTLEVPLKKQTPEEPVVIEQATITEHLSASKEEFNLTPELPLKERSLEEPVVTQEATILENLSVSKEEEFNLTPQLQLVEESVMTQEATTPEDLSVSKEEEFNLSPEVQLQEQTLEELVVTQQATIPEDLSVNKEELNLTSEVPLKEQTLEEPVVTQEATIPEDLSVSKEEEFNISPEVQEQTLEELVATQEATIPEDLSVSREESNLTPEVPLKKQILEEPVASQEATILEGLSDTKEEFNLTQNVLSDEQLYEGEPPVTQEVTLCTEEHIVSKEEQLLENISVNKEEEFNLTREIQSEKLLQVEEPVLSQEVPASEQTVVSNEQFEVVSEAESEEQEPAVIEETTMLEQSIVSKEVDVQSHSVEQLQAEECITTTETTLTPCITNEDFCLPLERKMEEQPQEEEPSATQEETISEKSFSNNEEIIVNEQESMENALVIHDAQEEPVVSNEELTLSQNIQLEKESSEEVPEDIDDKLVEEDLEQDMEGINPSPQQSECLIKEQSPEVLETSIVEQPVDSNEQALDLTQDIHSEKQVCLTFDEEESEFNQNETSVAETFAPKQESIMVNEAQFMRQPQVLVAEQKSAVIQQMENLETTFVTEADATESVQSIEEPQLIEEVVEEICVSPEEELTVIHKNKSIEEHEHTKLNTETQSTKLERHSTNTSVTTVIKKLKSRFYEITAPNIHQETRPNQSGSEVNNEAQFSVIQKVSGVVGDEKLDVIKETQANKEPTVIQELKLIQEPQLGKAEECVRHEDSQSSVLSEPAPRSSTVSDEEDNQYRTKLSAMEDCLEKPIANQEFGVTSEREIVCHESPKHSNTADVSEDLTAKKITDSSTKDPEEPAKKLPDSIFKIPASCVSKSEVRYKKNTFEHRLEPKKYINFTDLDEEDVTLNDLVTDIVHKLNQDDSDKNQEDLDIELEEEIIDISVKSRSPKVDLSKVIQSDMLKASFEDDSCRIKNYIEPSYSEDITGLEKSGENSESPIENKTDKTQKVEEYPKELEIHCANSNDSFKFCIQTNLSNLSRSEEISAIALATMSELKCDPEPATINNNVPADDLPKPDMFPEKLSETEMVAIEGNLTVMSEKDLGDAQVEITSEKVISPKKPITLSNFSMDFSESTSENDKNLDTHSKGTEFTSRAITKELKPRANVKKINAYNQGELLDILEGNEASKKAPEFQTQPKIVEDVECDFDEIISKNLISKDCLKPFDENFTEKDKSSPTSSKLFERLSDVKGESTRQETITETLTKQKSKSKPVILSEKIIKPAPEAKKVVPSSDSAVNDDEDLKTFVIPNIKKHIEEEAPPPAPKPNRKSRAKPSCKAKILQQTIITPSGEVLQPTVCLPKKKTILISPATSAVATRVSVEAGPSQTVSKTQIITAGARPTISTTSTSQDDNVFDIFNMPIVLSDQILTPESIESMPIVIDNNASANARTQSSTLAPTTKLTLTKPTTGYTRTIIPTKTITQPQKIIAKPKILQAATVKQPISQGKVLPAGVLPRGAKPGTYFFLSQGAPGSPQQKLIAKKTIVKRTVPIANIASKFPEGTGNKVMIVTDQQGQQQRVLFNPNNQRLLSYSTLSGSKIVKNVLKSNLIQKNISSVIKNEVGPSKSPTHIVQKVLPTSNQMMSVPSTSRTVKTVVRKVSPSTSKLPTTVKNSKTILLTGKNGQTIKKIAIAEDDIDKQVAEQLEAIKASSGLQFGSQTRPDVPSTSKQPIQKPQIRRSYAKKDFKPKPPVVTTISETPPCAPPPLVVSKKQTVPAPEPKKVVQVQEEPPVQVERPLQQMILEQPDGTIRTITEGEIIGFPSENISGETNSYVFMTLDSTGNLTPVSNEVLRKINPNLAVDGDLNNYVLQIGSADNGEGNQLAALGQPAVVKSSNTSEQLSTGIPKVDNGKTELPLTLPLTIEQPIPITIEQQRPLSQSLHVPLPETPVINMEVASSNGDQAQHILVSGDSLAAQKFLESLSGTTDLATLIANADGKSILIQTDNQQILINTSTDHQMLSNVPENTESGRNPIFATHSNKTDILAAALADTDVFSTQPSRGAQLSPNNALYPINVSNVLETSLTLSSPIMTPLEVPSTNNKKISDEEADILTHVPKNVDLPITITDPNISQTVANQQVATLMGNEFQSNLELGLAITETTISSVTTGLTSPSYSFSLPSLDENDISHKPFNSSMPLLNDDAEDTNLPHKKSNKHVDKSDLNSEDYLEQSRYTLGGTMCDSLSEPPPEMFEMPEVNSYNERNGNNIPLYLQNTPDSKDDDGIDASIQAESSSEGSCEIPLQPKIVAKSVDLSEESDL